MDQSPNGSKLMLIPTKNLAKSSSIIYCIYPDYQNFISVVLVSIIRYSQSLYNLYKLLLGSCWRNLSSNAPSAGFIWIFNGKYECISTCWMGCRPCTNFCMGQGQKNIEINQNLIPEFTVRSLSVNFYLALDSSEV